VIRVTVYQNPDLTLEARITEAGMLSYPLLGSVRLGGLGVRRRAAIADGLRNGNFVKQPQVTMTVLQVRGHQASVLGQVNRPGRYPLEHGRPARSPTCWPWPAAWPASVPTWWC
jgi:polysaccharide export outer membrane protein